MHQRLICFNICKNKLVAKQFGSFKPPEHTLFLKIFQPSVADPDPGSGDFLTPGSGMGEKQHLDPGSGSGMNNPDHISESLEINFLS
jgi:hypothetical protein